MLIEMPSGRLKVKGTKYVDAVQMKCGWCNILGFRGRWGRSRLDKAVDLL